MSISKKNKRKITVGKDIFYWTSDFQANIMRLTIMTDEKAHSRLVCDFDYKNFWLSFKDIVYGRDIKTPSWNLTPKIVQQVIDYAISDGWKPFSKGEDFIIQNIENKIDLNETNSVANNQMEIVSKVREMAIQNLKSKI